MEDTQRLVTERERNTRECVRVASALCVCIVCMYVCTPLTFTNYSRNVNARLPYLTDITEEKLTSYLQQDDQNYCSKGAGL